MTFSSKFVRQRGGPRGPPALSSRGVSVPTQSCPLWPFCRMALGCHPGCKSQVTWVRYSARMPIELRLLRCALALAEHGNFARAAEARHISQPSLSRNIQEIELRVGTQLFERTAGGAVPTDAGTIFLEHAREVVSRSQDLGREMDILRGLEKGELCIGACTYPDSNSAKRRLSDRWVHGWLLSSRSEGCLGGLDVRGRDLRGLEPKAERAVNSPPRPICRLKDANPLGRADLVHPIEQIEHAQADGHGQQSRDRHRALGARIDL